MDQNSALNVVRHRRTGAALYYKKPHPPFKNDSPVDQFPRSLAKVDQEGIKINVTKYKKFRNGDDQRVLFDFGNDYGFWQVYKSLEKQIPSCSTEYKVEHSKFFGEVAVSGPREMVKDAKNLSDDVFKLSSQEDMLHEFIQNNLF